MEWGTWSQETVEEALSLGRPVYVDFTADWCVASHSNKRAYSTEVQDIFTDHRVLLLQADLTNSITEAQPALEELGRQTVPTNALYVPGEDEPHLTTEAFGASYLLDFLNEHLQSAEQPD